MSPYQLPHIRLLPSDLGSSTGFSIHTHDTHRHSPLLMLTPRHTQRHGHTDIHTLRRPVFTETQAQSHAPSTRRATHSQRRIHAHLPSALRDTHILTHTLTLTHTHVHMCTHTHIHTYSVNQHRLLQQSQGTFLSQDLRLETEAIHAPNRMVTNKCVSPVALPWCSFFERRGNTVHSGQVPTVLGEPLLTRPAGSCLSTLPIVWHLMCVSLRRSLKTDSRNPGGSPTNTKQKWRGESKAE